MSDRTTRRQLLASGASVAAAGAGVATVTAAELIGAGSAGAATTSVPAPESDSDRLRRLLSVELLMLYCYQQVLATQMLKRRARRLLAPLPGQERAHVRALSERLTRLGASAPIAPGSVAQADRDLARRKVTGRLGQLQGHKDALRLLLSVEQVLVGAYFVALTKLQDPRLIELAAQIMASDAQHEALLGEALYPGDAQRAVPYGLVQGIQ